MSQRVFKLHHSWGKTGLSGALRHLPLNWRARDVEGVMRTTPVLAEEHAPPDDGSTLDNLQF